MDAIRIPPPAELDSLEDEHFRQVVRAFLRENYPEHLRNPPKRLHWAENREWYMKLAEKGWLCPGWPKEYGGLGLSPAKQIILTEEYERYGVARTNDHGIVMLGPLVIKYGTEAQKTFFLPKILSGEHVWCQGYSEPNAGSDLAALRTEAVLDGDHYVVNGQKIWTTLAMDANWIFLLVRTDKNAKKQEGISFLLVDMKTPGITVRPIINLEMHDEFCETFFDNVRVPKENLVGTLNKGWDMAKALLGFERIFLGSPRQSGYALSRLKLLAERMGLWEDAEFQDRYARLRLEFEDLKALFGTFVEKLKRGESLGPDVSMLKVIQTELFQKITDTMLEISGENAGLLEPMEGNRDLNIGGLYIQARPATIYGGSNEIQRNILSKNVLGLPG
ncbi:acyl-CoA dehydrogenase family protein [Siccirubricoccus sp. KC 17139]|uniref:Acyl-CoA dehydrogenase family protein n=1 Tax=Siccirubricoccus soli TaxID=2899147 RepID=A0ABT1D8P5_9PROT|nr:acyl-CoA dehydrogenase family protein [Siccirubricoccus soli]MCO6418310.1 acyl-CoA dehydrogenase family protein [Siccirubricoccus soli]MCP2684445.1 acyl-CoA dehydrogenase family protein [Siccirubricoccus soli]